MSDAYQATYDAVRSALRNTDVGAAIREACRIDASFAVDQVKQEFLLAAQEMQRPSAVYRAELVYQTKDGLTRWTANLGALRGEGGTPAEAMADFDRRWSER